jgi:hypothetical protein
MNYEAKAAYKQAARAMRKANAVARKRSADRLGRASVSLAMFYAPLMTRATVCMTNVRSMLLFGLILCAGIMVCLVLY